MAMLMYLYIICKVLSLSNVNLPSLSWKLNHVLDESLMPIFTIKTKINFINTRTMFNTRIAEVYNVKTANRSIFHIITQIH